MRATASSNKSRRFPFSGYLYLVKPKEGKREKGKGERGRKREGKGREEGKGKSGERRKGEKEKEENEACEKKRGPAEVWLFWAARFFTCGWVEWGVFRSCSASWRGEEEMKREEEKAEDVKRGRNQLGK